MSIWWFLWFILSAIMLGTTGWSLVILFKQKKAWEAYAKKKGLVFSKGTFSGPCGIDGSLNGFTVSLFTATQQKEDSRKNRQITVVQISLPKPFLDSLAAGTAEMLPFLNSLNLLTPHAIDSDKFDAQKGHVFTRNKKAIDVYLTEERIVVLNNLLRLANSDNLVILSEEEGVFRFETSNPLTDEGKLEKLIDKLMMNATKLQPSAAEIKKFEKLYTKKSKDQPED